MLYPQSNLYRQRVDLSGYWNFKLDPHNEGIAQTWFNDFTGEPIAVPASWNEQFVDTRDYIGIAWYQTEFDCPWGWEDNQTFVRFGSVNYLAQVWINGHELGEHEGGHLPFKFDISPYLKPEGNRIVVRVDGNLARDRVPPGLVDNPMDSHKVDIYPQTTYDFFPYCGIHRRVWLYSQPYTGITDITVQTTIDENIGSVKINLTVDEGKTENKPIQVRFTLSGYGSNLSIEQAITQDTITEQIDVSEPALWSPDTPNLYDLTVELLCDSQIIDRYKLSVGIRTIDVQGDKLLLNGKPITLTGFGRHEDFPITGRGTVPAVNIKDFALLDWIGANSFRTSHYPYDEEMLTLADELGFLVISETPAVGLFFAEEGLERRLHLCRQYTRELIERDKNHPSVIMWSLANEARSVRGNEVPFFQNLYSLAKSLDDSRPITIVSDLFTEEASFSFFDVVCLNIYRGWYQESGELEAGFQKFAEIVDTTHDKFQKPMLITEFGADAIPGHHALPPEMFSEEYQADMLEGYIHLMNKRDFIVGQHVWNMCDFKTAQGVKRPMAINFKGVFTRDRRPKLGAHRLRKLWRKTQSALETDNDE